MHTFRITLSNFGNTILSMSKKLLILILLNLILTTNITWIKANPLYSTWNTNNFRLIITYNDEAVNNEAFTLTLHFDALSNLTIRVMNLTLWLISGPNYKLLYHGILIENQTVIKGWSTERVISIVLPSKNYEAEYIMLELQLIYNITSQYYDLSYSALLLPVRSNSYENLKNKVTDLKSELSYLKKLLNETKTKYTSLLGKYTQLNQTYYKLKNYFNKTIDKLQRQLNSIINKYGSQISQTERYKTLYNVTLHKYLQLKKNYTALLSENKKLYNETNFYKVKYYDILKNYNKLLEYFNELMKNYTVLMNITIFSCALNIAFIIILVYLMRKGH